MLTNCVSSYEKTVRDDNESVCLRPAAHVDA